MIINTKNLPEIGMKPREDGTYNIFKEGKYLFKIVGWEEKGFSKDGDAMFVINLQGIEIGKKDIKYSHNELYNIGALSLIHLKKLEVALKSPEVYNLDDWKDRFVIANIEKNGKREYNGKLYDRFSVASWEYSDYNNKLAPIPEAKEEDNDAIPVAKSEPVIEISDDDIPF